MLSARSGEQVAVLKALAHAYLTAKPAQTRWEQAEETLRMVLVRVRLSGMFVLPRLRR